MNTPTFEGHSLEAIHADGVALVEAGRLAPDAVVPSCPDWSVAELIGHVSGAHRWGSQAVSEGITPQIRILAEYPQRFGDLVAWYNAGLAQLESTLRETDPDALVWTPTSGSVGSRWWRRKLAVETALHRWDAEYAVGQVVSHVALNPLDGAVALAGIAEYASDFLPGMIARAGRDAPRGAVQLRPSDSEESWHLVLQLDKSDSSQASENSCSVSGTASDLLLWIWNRLPAPEESLQFTGSADLVRAWRSLTI